jgi:DNA-binding transcriptional LysR family regulator
MQTMAEISVEKKRQLKLAPPPDITGACDCRNALYEDAYFARSSDIGLAYVGEWMVADDIASGRLVEVLSEWTPSYPGYCLYYPGRRHMAASLRAFVDLAKEVVFRNRAKAS